MKLLLVDDSELIRSRLIGMLDGITGVDDIFTAASLAQTLDCVRRDLPTLVLLDLHLPDGNALSIIPTLKVLSPQIRIAMLTNDAGPLSRSQCMRAGAHWFFDKSTECQAALDMVRALAARSTGSEERGGQQAAAGPSQGGDSPLGGQRSTRSDQRGGQLNHAKETP